VPYILVASGESLYRQQVMRDIGTAIPSPLLRATLRRKHM
jgi:hypothetical protein